MRSEAICPFCHPEESIIRNTLAYVRPDKYPVNPGHVLVIPYRHVANYFDATADEREAILSLLDQAKAWLDRDHAPAGYNVGVNVGAAAGQTIMHLHVHLIPRYPGDVADPRGGVRGVIPARQSY